MFPMAAIQIFASGAVVVEVVVEEDGIEEDDRAVEEVATAVDEAIEVLVILEVAAEDKFVTNEEEKVSDGLDEGTPVEAGC
jgi:hypothetical protein